MTQPQAIALAILILATVTALFLTAQYVTSRKKQRYAARDFYSQWSIQNRKAGNSTPRRTIYRSIGTGLAPRDPYNYSESSHQHRSAIEKDWSHVLSVRAALRDTQIYRIDRYPTSRQERVVGEKAAQKAAEKQRKKDRVANASRPTVYKPAQQSTAQYNAEVRAILLARRSRNQSSLK